MHGSYGSCFNTYTSIKILAGTDIAECFSRVEHHTVVLKKLQLKMQFKAAAVTNNSSMGSSVASQYLTLMLNLAILIINLC